LQRPDCSPPALHGWDHPFVPVRIKNRPASKERPAPGEGEPLPVRPENRYKEGGLLRNTTSFPCPSCGTPLSARLSTGALVGAIVAWPLLEVPFLKLDEQFHFLGGFIRILISLGIGIAIVAAFYQIFGTLSSTSETEEHNKVL
jgi:hypothetical protein